MKRETELDLIDRLLAHVDAGTTSVAMHESAIPVAAYTSSERFEAEREALFRRQPILVAHASELDAPGSFISHDALGVPLLLSRDREGAIRAHLNVCRHRGHRLVSEERGERKGFVCGYHGWSYGLDGRLVHRPHAARFDDAACARDLVAVPVAVRAGLVWVVATAGAAIDMHGHLGGLSDELDALGLDGAVAFRTASVRRRFHWKLLVDAFLDGYHLRHLHRDSVARFFLDNVNLADAFPPHIRSFVARRSLETARAAPREAWRHGDFASLTYFVFPNTVLVLHPDWVSRITLFPVSLDETIFTHTMIVPERADTLDRRPHWEKTWALIHGQVFEDEDIVAAERIQQGLASRANESFVCGRHEYPIRWFHDAVERALAVR